VWWIGCYAVFLAINIIGVELTFKSQLLLTLAAIFVLVVFYIGVLQKGAFHGELLFNVAPDAGESATGLPKGIFGIFAAFPFAIWWYLAIESLPLAAEETHDVVRDVPKALITGIFTLLALSLLVLVLNTGVGGGADAMGKSAAPMSDGLAAVFGNGALTTSLVVLALAGLLTTIHGSIYAYGRVIFALSRAGYLPRVLSITGKRKTPWMALLVGGVIGLGAVFLIDSFGSTSKLGAALLNMAVFGAVISYSIVMISYIKLKISRKDLPRPYKSPLGIPGRSSARRWRWSRCSRASRTRIFDRRCGPPRSFWWSRSCTSSSTAAHGSSRRLPRSGWLSARWSDEVGGGEARPPAPARGSEPHRIFTGVTPRTRGQPITIRCPGSSRFRRGAPWPSRPP